MTVFYTRTGVGGKKSERLSRPRALSELFFPLTGPVFLLRLVMYLKVKLLAGFAGNLTSNRHTG
jgi:hypothetical protein